MGGGIPVLRQGAITLLIMLAVTLAGCNGSSAQSTPAPGGEKEAAVKASEMTAQVPASSSASAAEVPTTGAEGTAGKAVDKAAGKAEEPPAAPDKQAAGTAAEGSQAAPPAATQVAVSASGDGKNFFAVSSVELKAGETVLDVTRRAAAQANVKLNVRGFGVTAYVAGIGGLNEFDRGPMSGWLYRVNGEYPNTGCGTFKLQAGDRVEWVYTTGEKRPGAED